MFKDNKEGSIKEFPEGTDVKVLAPKVAVEVAEAEFGRFTKIWDIFSDIENMTDEEKDSFSKQKRIICRKISSGHAVIDEEGKITFELQHAKNDTTKLEINIPSGGAQLTMDNHKESKHVHKLYNYMGDMTGKAPNVFAQMDGRDIKFPQAVVTLFLAE